nr:hypothetical protein [Flavobacterium sp. ASV13]
MKKLPAPTELPADVFLLCIGRIKKPLLKARLSACQNLIDAAAIEFHQKAALNQTFQIVPETIINTNVTSDELSDVYTMRMAKKKAPGRPLYEKLKASAPNDVCPICGHRIVSTLDHYLPKALYPRLSVVPINLVPCCSDCNKTKLHSTANSSEEETLHPYYDNIENVAWLKAQVVHTTPPSILYGVHPHQSWSSILSERVKNHFNTFEINKLYSSQAAVELSSINYRLEKLFSSGGSAAVREHLQESAESAFHANKNSWQSALYTALYQDSWFCNAGFRF